MRTNKYFPTRLVCLALAVALGLLTACQNQATTTTSDAGASGSLAIAQAAPGAAPAAAGTPAVDFAGGPPPADGTAPAGGPPAAGNIAPGSGVTDTRRVAPGQSVTNTTGAGNAAPTGGTTSANNAVATALPARVVTASTSVAADGALALAGPLVTLAFEASGKVAAVHAVPGQAVKKGDILAELDATALNNALQQAQASLALKQAQIDSSLAPASQSDIDTAKANLNSAYAAYNDLKAGPTASTVDQALHSWNQAKNSLYQSQLSRDQVCKFIPGTTTEAEMAKAKTDTECKMADMGVQSSEMRERTAYQSYLDAQQPATQDALTKAWASVVQAQTSLVTLRQGASADQKQVYDLQLEQAKLTVERAQRDLAQARLVSPCACVVQAVDLSAGTNASSGGNITLLDAARLQFRTTNLSERDVVTLQAGQAVTIRLKAFEQTLTGKVGAILPVSSGASGTLALFTVLIDLDPTTLALLPGMTGQAQISLK